MPALPQKPRFLHALLLSALTLYGCAEHESDPELEASDPSGDVSIPELEASASLVRMIEENFESGELASPPFTVSGDVKVQPESASGGGQGVRLGRGASLTTTVDTVGLNNLFVSFDARGIDLERSDSLVVSWALPNRPFTTISRSGPTYWAPIKVRLPGLAANRVGVRVRISVIGSNSGDTADTVDAADIDNLVIAGLRTSGPADGGVGGRDPKVVITEGTVEGKVVGSAHAFLGIPYAKPPVGELRFAPPQPAPFFGARAAKEFAPSCPQSDGGLSAPGPRSEDCLYLNVYKPAQTSRRRLPVMVWIHGGAFISGGSSSYDGARLASEGPVVVVTMNYRLGGLGFLSLPELDKARGRAPSGNDGLRDQQVALQWVKRNIAAFGGDPDNVTVFGESAGSMSTCLQMVTPTGHDLAKRFILESGACVGGLKVATKAEANAVGAQLVAALCPGAADPVACLREKDFKEILAWGSDRGLFGPGWAPVSNPADPFMPKTPAELIAARTYPKREFIIGTNKNEWGLFLNLPGGKLDLSTAAAFGAVVDKQFGPLAAKVKEHYAVTDATAQAVYIRLMTDSTFRCPTRKLARLASSRGAPVYLYSFEEGLALHAFEIPYVFGNPSANLGTPVLNEALRATVQSYWRQFAINGNPNVAGQPVWPGYNAMADQHMTLKATSEVGTGLSKPDCDFWDALIP